MGKMILLIEDDLDLQRIYSSKLQLSGFDVKLAGDAMQGYTIAKETKPNIVLLDIMLPGQMNGFDLLKRLKEDDHLKSIPVIVLTNLDTEKQEALKVGAVAYIIKANTNLDELVAKVKLFIR